MSYFDRDRDDEETVEIYGSIMAETPKAWLVLPDTEDEDDPDAGRYWLPKSRVTYERDRRFLAKGTFTIPVWLATEKGMV